MRKLSNNVIFLTALVRIKLWYRYNLKDHKINTFYVDGEDCQKGKMDLN